MLRFSHGGAASHVGLVRDTNEDAGFAAPHLQLVADGVGGAAAGEVASATVGYVVSALAALNPTMDPARLLERAVAECHRQLHAGVAAAPERSGMATTLTAALARGDQVTLVHIGDSRAYRLRGDRLARLTNDHTLVQALVEEGRISAQQATESPYRSVVLRFIGAEEPPEPQVHRVDVVPGDRLLLCSDGLTDLVDEAQIAHMLAITDQDQAAAALVDAALHAGGRDNVTCLVADVEVDDGPLLSSDGVQVGTMRNPYLVVDPSGVRLPRSA